MKNFLKGFRVLCLLLVSGFLFSSCAEFDAQIPVTNNSSSRVSTPSTDWRGNVTTCSFAWGLISDSPAMVTNGTGGLQNVRVTRDFWQGLVSFVTLGAVNPVNFQWQLAGPPIQGGTIPDTP